MSVTNTPNKRGLGNPTNVIIVFLIVVVFGMGLQISIANVHQQENEKQQNQIIALTNRIITLEEHDHKQTLALLEHLNNDLGNTTMTGRPH